MKSIIYVLTLIVPTLSFSQSGPGGVSSSATNLRLWLDSRRVNNDGSNPTLGSEVVTWHDQSGNNVDVTRNQASVATYSATGVTFNNTGYLLGSETGFPTGNSPRSVIVCAASPSTTQDDVMFFYGTASANNSYGILKLGSTNGVRGFFFNNDLDVAGGFTPSSTLKIITSTYGANTHNIYVNNGAASTDNAGFPTNTTLGDGLQIGGWQEFAPITLSEATIAEVIFYDKLLNPAERIIANNYLAAKYNLTLAANDLYDGDAAPGNFDYDVAGVGRAAAGEINTIAQSSIMTINASAADVDLENNEYFIWGHDNGSLATTTAGVPGTVQRRFTRIWAASEVDLTAPNDGITNLDVQFNLAGLGSVTATDLRLLVDTNGDGSFVDGGGSTVLSGATLVSGTTYQFSNVTVINNNARFTLGTADATQTPLPVHLLSFQVTSENDHVALSWKTASEINNDRFEIERSINGTDWIKIGEVKGAGTSASPHTYKFNDALPQHGINYYRLKQIDFDLQFEYSEVRSLEFHYYNLLFPNPTTGKITLTNVDDSIDLTGIQVFNSMGQSVNGEIAFTAEDNQVLLDLSGLPSGIYIIKTKTTSHLVSKE